MFTTRFIFGFSKFELYGIQEFGHTDFFIEKNIKNIKQINNNLMKYLQN